MSLREEINKINHPMGCSGNDCWYCLKTNEILSNIEKRIDSLDFLTTSFEDKNMNRACQLTLEQVKEMLK